MQLLKKLILAMILFGTAVAIAEEEQPVQTSKKLRFFNLDLHISVIADVRNILESMGHEVVDWTLSGHAWLFGRERNSVEIVNQESWYYLDQRMCNQFYERYKDFLSQFDGFIVTHTPSFSLLFEKTNKPIIIINSTRYEHPFTVFPDKWNWLNGYLKSGVENKRIFIVSNNKGDQQYLKYYTGIDSVHIPSLCEYTRAHYTPKKEGFFFKFNGSPPIKNQGVVENNRIGHPHTWQELFECKGIVHMPYQISTMSIFEQYTANVPLFFPSKTFLRTLQLEGKILYQLSYYRFWDWGSPNIPGDPNNLNDPSVTDFWLNAADFYDEKNLPFIQYFDSYDHLEYLLQTTDCQRVSQEMKDHNVIRRKMIFEKWKTLLKQAFPISLKKSPILATMAHSDSRSLCSFTNNLAEV